MHDPAPLPLFCLHFLGGSARGWDDLAGALPTSFEATGVDLPGFGGAASVPGYAVASMADHVAGMIAARAGAAEGGRYMLAGHSMGAKVAAVLARRAEDGAAGLHGLCGLVLMAGSPPAPEPMDEARRTEMLGWFQGDEARCRREARGYIRANAADLAGEARDRLVEGMLPARLAAWVAWLEGGSREDWRDRVGVLRTKALVLSGAEDADLGEATQTRLTLPHLRDAEHVVLKGTGHLVPMERAGIVAGLIAERFADVPGIPAGYRALIGSERVSSGTRAVLLARAAAAEPTDLLTPLERGTLRAVVARVVPQGGPGRIDLATTLAANLAGPGDGWRPLTLPEDRAAWSLGLETLAAEGFAGLEAAAQDAVLEKAAGGRLDGALGGAQMKAWFEDLRAEAVRLYVAHPATFARMRYSGIGYGGDGPEKAGFTALGMGQREAWEPA